MTEAGPPFPEILGSFLTQGTQGLGNNAHGSSPHTFRNEVGPTRVKPQL